MNDQSLNKSVVDVNYSELATRVCGWAESTEGQNSLKKTAAEIKQMLKESEENRKLNHEILRKLMTI